MPVVPLVPPKALSFARRNVSPPARHYVTQDDAVRFVCLNLALEIRLRLSVRVLRPTGEILMLSEDPVLPAGTDPLLVTLQQGEGFLLSAAARTRTNSVRRGDVWSEIQLVRPIIGAQEAIHLLAADYIYGRLGPSWPEGGIHSSVAGPGRLVGQAQADPAAGAELVFTVPGTRRWRFVAAYFELTTSAAGGDRRVNLQVRDEVPLRVSQFQGISTQPISTTHGYTLAPIPIDRGLIDAQHFRPLPPDLYLRGDWEIRTQTDGIGAADQFAAARILFEEWLEWYIEL